MLHVSFFLFYFISEPREVPEMGTAWLLFGSYPGPSTLPQSSTYKAERLLSYPFIIPELIMLAALCIVRSLSHSFWTRCPWRLDHFFFSFILHSQSQFGQNLRFPHLISCFTSLKGSVSCRKF
jgi:hypothetical protein